MKIKLYYAKHVNSNATIQFQGTTLVTNNPFIFEFITNFVNEKIGNEESKIDMKNFEIIEVEIEGEVNEKK